MLLSKLQQAPGPDLLRARRHRRRPAGFARNPDPNRQSKAAVRFSVQPSSARFIVALCAGGVLATIARGELQWRGTLVEHDVPTFALTDTETGNSKWVPVGGQFLTYSVENYDADRQILVLNHNGARTEIKLARPEPKADTPPPVVDELAGLNGLPLAEGLAGRGDLAIRELLAQHRAAVLQRDDLVRRIDVLEKTPPSTDATAAARRVTAANELKAEAQRTDVEIARLTSEITAMADEHRKNPPPPSGK